MKKISILFIIVFLCTAYTYAQSGSIELTADYSEREVAIHTPSGNLYGTLVIPINNERSIVALIIPDFGLTDRDGNSPQVTDSNSLKLLAEDLAKEGVSTLRIEKREVTESKSLIIAKSGVRIEDMVEDAVSWLRFLKADKRFSKIAVIGHGEGALVGMLASEIADVKYYISIGGASKPGYEIVENNLVNQLTAEQMDTVRIYIKQMRGGNMLQNVSSSLTSIFNSSIQPYLISWFKYNPVVEIANLKAKILLVQGTSDMQVCDDDFVDLSTACPDSEKLVINKMNHMLKADKKNGSHEKACNLLAKGLVEGISQFLKN